MPHPRRSRRANSSLSAQSNQAALFSCAPMARCTVLCHPGIPDLDAQFTIHNALWNRFPFRPMQNIHYQETALALARLSHSMKTPTNSQPIQTHLSSTEKELI